MNNEHCFVRLLVACVTGYSEYDDYGLTPLAGHSLSWHDAKRPTLGPNNTMTAKTWHPEVPPRQTDQSDGADQCTGFLTAQSGGSTFRAY